MRVAIFPLPTSVVFPGQKVPLHIFEPRYRAMFRDCTDNSVPIALAWGARTLAQREAGHLPVEERLQKNQSTYQPAEVFAGGPATILSVLEDGRMMTEIEVIHRFRLQKIEQAIPYLTGRVERLPEVLSDEEALQGEMQRIYRAIEAMLVGSDTNGKALVESLTTLHPEGQLAKLLQIVQMNPAILQEMLEHDDLLARAAMLAEVLESAAGTSEPAALPTERPAAKVIPLYPDKT